MRSKEKGACERESAEMSVAQLYVKVSPSAASLYVYALRALPLANVGHSSVAKGPPGRVGAR